MQYPPGGYYPPLKPQQRRRSPWAGRLVLSAVLLVVVLVFWRALYTQQFDSFFRGLEPSCSIGIAPASITVQAWSANSDCQAMMYNGADNFTGIDWYKWHAGPVSDTSGAIMCELDINGRHVIVRDGMSNTGSTVCWVLEGQPVPIR